MPNFIILDLNLPKKGGKDFLKELKADPVLKKIPVLIFTSSDAETDITECYAAGASCYLSKPMHFEEYLKLVDSLCKFWLCEVKFANVYA